MNLKTLKNLDRDDLLSLVGLETRRTSTDWILPAVGFFSAGVLLGAGLGMLMAPKSGRELMEEIRVRMQGDNAQGLASGNSYSAPGAGMERTPHSV
jgi:hypothetical protein